ncbi:hypothetical protein AB0M57_04275 [Streptomyces sp. NPDC051597]|uniref:hypothetical protein n=1 Tax=Streptomyces sp. NPDC051597 TaxID=3155049 RepID=UPI003423045F
MVPSIIPDRVADLISQSLPSRVQLAVKSAADAEREVRRFRWPLGVEDRADREDALSRLAAANKVLAAHNPGLIVRIGGVR